MPDIDLPAAFRADVAAMPPALRHLLEQELAAGNQIVSIGHSFPAPPIGAFAMLARQVSTVPRASGETLKFRARNSSLCSGEFTDDAGVYFILEPAGAPPEEEDMDAIRAAHDAPRFDPSDRPQMGGGSASIARFLDSMVIDYEKWHDGIGYDIDALRESSADERAFAERRLAPPKTWHDVEALAALAELGSDSARDALRRALDAPATEVRMAVMRHAPDIVDDATRAAALVTALESASAFGGLDATLTQVEEFHPPAVVAALFRGLITRDGETACHLAAMLAFLHGKAESSFDWAMRPLFLEFVTTDPRERIAAFRSLCATIEVDAEPLLDTIVDPVTLRGRTPA